MRMDRTPVTRWRLPIWLVLPMMALTLVVGLAGGFVLGNYVLNRPILPFQSTSDCPLSSDECQEFASFWQAWNIASKNFVDPQAIDTERMTDGAIEGMLDSLGDAGHTRYLPPEVAEQYKESLQGRFEGIGAYIDVKDDQPLIVQPIEGSPAERAGIKPGDLILKVNGEDVRGVTVEELRSKVRGPTGSTVTLTILHEGEEAPVDVQVVREEIKVPSTSWRMLPNKVALVKLVQFSAPAPEDMRAALSEAKAQGAQSIVLDLRNNPGGFVNALVDIASEFMPEGKTILLQENREGVRQEYKTHGGGVATDIPLVVIVNNNTASAAEILAGALRDQGRARVIGTATFGTATVLNQFDLTDGGRILLGTSQWLTPKGEEVRGVGIAPDEVVDLPSDATPLTPREAAELSAQALRESSDVQLRRALELVDGLADRQP